MNAPLQTADVSAPPSIALALMAWRRAWLETYGCHPFHFDPVGRKGAEWGAPATNRWYEILDCISAGEKP